LRGGEKKEKRGSSCFPEKTPLLFTTIPSKKGRAFLQRGGKKRGGLDIDVFLYLNG